MTQVDAPVLSEDMSEAEHRAMVEELVRRQAAEDFTTYKQIVRPDYVRATHLDRLDKACMSAEAFVRTKGQEGHGRHIVSMPPRHGKTMTVAELFPAWFLGKHPDWWVMVLSYGADLAEASSDKARGNVSHPHHAGIFGNTLSPHSKAKARWKMAGHRGGYIAQGLGGGVTGKGAHLLIMDDLIKNRANAENKRERDAVWDEYLDTAKTRLDDPFAAIFLIMTRWHVDDLAGRLMLRQPGKWNEIAFPAIAYEDDPLGRAEGVALWPERFPLETLLEIKEERPPYSWSSLFQQSPFLREGGLFNYDWFEDNRWRLGTDYQLEDLRQVVISVDPEAKEMTGDETGIMAVGEHKNGHVVILEDASAHYSPEAWGRKAIALYHRYNADYVMGEINNGGDMVKANLNALDANIPFDEVTATRGKYLRAQPVATIYSRGRAHHNGTFEILEDQMVTWREGGPSPNRLDALVHGVTKVKNLGEDSAGSWVKDQPLHKGRWTEEGRPHVNWRAF